MNTDNNTFKDNNKTLYYSLVCGLPSLAIIGLSTYVYLNRNRLLSCNKKKSSKCCKCCKCGDDCKCNPCKCCKCGDDCCSNTAEDSKSSENECC
jgi:hypothetical protein